MNNNNIQKKLTSLTLMAIMVAGGMTFAVPGMVPEAYAANANLFVSAENSQFDNYMSGPQVIEVAIIDSSISDTDEGKGEPDVTVNGNNLRMVQATDGNWYGYFADKTMAELADSQDNGLDFGTSGSASAIDLTEFEADGLFYNMDENVNVVREEKNINSFGSGQIGVDADAWPFIQLYTLNPTGNVVIQYNKGGGAQSTTLTFDTVDDFAGIELDRASYPQGAEVHATITDAWLNIDPTDEDSWTFNTVSGDAFYHVYNDNGGIGENTSLEDDGTGLQSVSVGDLMCSDCALKLIPNVQGTDKHVITIQGNADSRIANDGATALTADAWVIPGTVITVLDKGTQPVTITEQGPNSGIFGTYDESDTSILTIIDDADRGTSATVDYNDSPVSVLVTHAFATIDIQPASDTWNSGELIPVVLVDADVNKNSRADEDISLSDPSYKIIPSLRTGSPITLGSGDIMVSYNDGNMIDTSVDAFSDRAILNDTVYDGDRISSILIDLGITGEELQASLVDTTDDKNYGYNLFNYDISSLTDGTAKISLVNTTTGVSIDVDLACDASGSGLQLLNGTTCDKLTGNVAPDLAPIGDRSETAGTLLSFPITATDANNDKLTYSVRGNPEGSSLDENTGIFTWDNPTEGTTNNVVFTVDDGNGGTDTETITITITASTVIPLLYSGNAYESQHFGTAFDKAVADNPGYASKKIVLGENAIQAVLDTGAKGAVGTYTSQQLKDLNDTGKVGTDDGDIVLLSYSSAAKSFAKADDGIFRLTVDSSRQVDSIITELIPANFDNIISIHLDDAWSNDYVDALEEEYGAKHETIAYDTGARNISTEFNTVLRTGLSGLDAQTAIVILEFDHDRLDALITELANKTGNSYRYTGIDTTKFIIPDVPSGAFGDTLSSDALALLKATDMKTIKFALNDRNQQGQDTLKAALQAQSTSNEVDLDSFGDIFDRHAYAAYDAGQILTQAIKALGSEYTSEQLNKRIPLAAEDYSSNPLIYRTVLGANGDLECMVYDIFEIDDTQPGFALSDPTQETTDATNCPKTIPDPQAPNAPTNLVAQGRTAEVSLTWDAPTSGDRVTGYTVQQSTDGTNFVDSTTATITGTTAMVTGLTNEQQYHFRVLATNAVGNSEPSNVDTATPSPRATAPEQVTGLNATAGDTFVTLEWNQPHDGNSEITSYTVEHSTDAGNTFTPSTVDRTGPTATTVTVTGLTNDQVYQFRVSAVNAEGPGPVSINVQETPIQGNTAPVIQPITAQSGQVGTALTFDITANDADAGDSIAYNMTPQLTGATVVRSADGATFTWPSPIEGTHTVTITARDGRNGMDTETVTITIEAAPNTGGSNNPPVIQPITAQSGQVGTALTFDITANDADAGDSIAYNMTPQLTGATVVRSADGATFTWPSPIEGTHTVTITARDGRNGMDTETVTITIEAAPTPVVYPPRVAFDANSDVLIPMIFDNVDYERQFFDAFAQGVLDHLAHNASQSDHNYIDQPYYITSNPTRDIENIVTNGSKAAVGTYTSEQLKNLNDTGKVGTDIVLLSYASTASTLTENTTGIFRLTTDNKHQADNVLKDELTSFAKIISIHRGDEWSNDYVKILEAQYGAKHDIIAYNSSLTGAALDGDIMSKVNPATVGTIAADTAIVILGFGEVETVIMELAKQTTIGTYDHTGIDTTKIFIPDFAASIATDLNADGLDLLKATDMKTIKFALKNDDKRSALNTLLYSDSADKDERHVYAAYDAGKILARAIDELGKAYTVDQLKTKLPEVSRDYNSEALIHSTVLSTTTGDLECTTYDVLEINDTASSVGTIVFKPDTTPTSTCDDTDPDADGMSVPILSNPQTVSCIDCAINSFGEIFGQTVQVQSTTTTAEPVIIDELLKVPNNGTKLGLLIEYHKNDVKFNVKTDAEADPIVLDFFAFGFGEDGRTANQIVRLELEETGDNTDTFVGGLEYTMLNQLNILDADTYTGLSPISDEPTFIVMEDLTDEDSPRVNYLDLGADGVATQIADQQEAPSHSGVVALDSDNYKVADTVTITLTDADLNVDSDLIDIFTTVEKGDLANIVGKDVSMSYGKNITESGAPLGRVLDVTFDDELWTANNCGVNDALHSTGFTLIETETASGVFTGSFQIPTMYCPTEINDKANEDGKRVSVTGTDIEVNYLDYRDASGEIIEVGDSAGVRASTGSISLDRTVYPVPFGENAFDLHASAGENQHLEKGDVSIHVRISDPDYDLSASGEDKIAQNNVTNMNVDGTADKVGPVIVTVSRGSDKVVVATAGGTNVIEANTIGDNAKEYGPITEIAPDAGIFEADITISSTDGPNTSECPDSDGCVLQGDIITVQYNDPTDASGDANTITDSATFDLRNAVLQSDKSVYIIGSDMILTLIEPDFDLDSDGAETYSLDLIEWDSDAATTSMGPLGGDNAAAFDPEPNAFRETGDSTGIFQVVVEIPEELSGDKLERGEEIELEYTDWGPSGSNYVGEEDEDINLTVFTSNFGSTVELDQKVYTWTDKVYITIVAPDHNFDSDLIDEIGNSDDDPIRIATRSADLDNYKLVETGTDTGIFTGEVILTGFEHDANGDGDKDDSNPRTGDGVDPKNTEGLGPTNGFLETEDDDGLSVSFEFSEDETVIGSSLIRWNIGEVQWLEASYAASGTGLVRVVDPDMNLNPESVDNFEIDIWSDTHAGGIDLTVTETNQATGIFEGTVFFTVTDESSGHRLRVSEGDTVTAEYEDRTLPDPHDTTDKIDISATTQIGSLIPPLERAPATNLRVVDAFSNTLDTISVDSQVQITADLANGQDKDQPFAYIVQIQDSSSVTVALAWVSGTLTPSQSFSPALSWTPTDAGKYTATAFVWESVDNPTALSPPNELTITVN